MTSSSSARIYYLDSMRAILMVLGVVIHSAQIYSTKHALPIVNGETSVFMSYLIDTIHLFRMPAFFVVSGFFCYITLNKYGIPKFLRLRLVRIAVPLVVTIFTFNMIQFYLLKEGGWVKGSLASHFINGGYIGHLWFLVNLIYYFIFTAIIHNIGLITKFRTRVIESTWFNKTPVLVLLFALPIITILIMALNKLGFPIYVEKFGLYRPYSLLYYYVHFVFGYVLASNRHLYHNFMKVNPLISIVLIVIGCTISGIFATSNDTLITIAAEYSYLAAQWFSIALCFTIFSRLFDHRSHFMAFFSEASYTVYLFHFILLMLVSSLLVKLDLDYILGFTLSIVIVTSLSVAAHVFIIRKSKILGFLYNGKSY
ncbi:acyltransferase family protein [Alteromonas pelagimontana]|uniref:Acyltransferase family protein n=1 Tax=Alteromonas pelagimontana TaxID=1858656 RepID=A0A6M4MFV2_9ALTE|nr:acyltransferase family protein [Alteromonas pelagimontana]QJR81989.1 acyltransferase family protein [Alteromonas pelagimontana]